MKLKVKYFRKLNKQHKGIAKEEKRMLTVKELQDFLNELVRKHPEVLEKEVQICTVLDDFLDFCGFETADSVRFQETDNPADGKTVVLVVE